MKPAVVVVAIATGVFGGAAATAAVRSDGASVCSTHSASAHCLAFRLQDNCVWNATAAVCVDDTPCDQRSAARCEFELTTGEAWDATQNKCFINGMGACQWSDTCWAAGDAESCMTAGCSWKELCTPKDMRFDPGPGVCRAVCVTPVTTAASTPPGGAGVASTQHDRRSRARRAPSGEFTQTDVLETPVGYRLRGLQNKAVELYLGVPFAAAPVGELRWRPPVGIDAWDGVFNATSFGAGCMRASAGYDLFNDGACNGFTRGAAGDANSGACAGYSEDCLSLNIYAPAGSSSSRPRQGKPGTNGTSDTNTKQDDPGKPVMVWIHGGCFVSGEGAQYNGTLLSINEDVVVVTVNYRLGSLGFLAHDALRSRDTMWGSTGNYGLLDNVAALEWVKLNIASFGGDPTRVTIFGESSGAGSVSQLLGAPMAWPHFHAAIMESGLAAFWTWMNMGAARHNFDETLEAGDCSGAGNITQQIDCLVGVAATSIAGAVSTPFCRDSCQWTPVIDGVVVPGRTVSLARQGKLRPFTPIIAGYNLNDGGSFVGRPHSMDDAELGAYFATRFGPNRVDELRATYGSPDASLPPGCTDSFMRASACETDWSYACETYFVANSLAGQQGDAHGATVGADGHTGSKPAHGEGQQWQDVSVAAGAGGFDDDGVFVYEFSQVSASSGLCLHGADTGYVFGTVTSATSEGALAVSTEMQQLWAEFARTGVPSATWPRWATTSPQLLNITAPASYVTAPPPTCQAFFEPNWDYYATCMPNNPELQPP